jgi:hypothetical protein
MCATCYEQWLLDNNPEYKAKAIAKRAEWATRNRARCYKAAAKWRAKPANKRAIAENRRKAVYGISSEEYGEMRDAQNGRCAICGTAGDLCVDHCHNTGVVRGLLCSSCNSGIGLLGDSADTLQHALDYLQRSQSHAARQSRKG